MTRMLRLPEVMARVSLGRATIYRHMKKGLFPQQVKMGGAAGWREDEIDALIAKLSAARPATPPTPASS